MRACYVASGGRSSEPWAAELSPPGDLGVSRDWLRGRPLPDFRRRRRNLPLPLERVKIGGPGARCSTSAWLLHRGCHPHPSPLPQGRGSKSGVSQVEIGPSPSRVVAGWVRGRAPHLFRPKTPEPASPLGEGEERRPRRKVLDLGLVASPRQPPSPQPSPSRAREEEAGLLSASQWPGSGWWGPAWGGDPSPNSAEDGRVCLSPWRG